MAGIMTYVRFIILFLHIVHINTRFIDYTIKDFKHTCGISFFFFLLKKNWGIAKRSWKSEEKGNSS